MAGRKPIDLTGRNSGRWTVFGIDPKDKRKWLCRCIGCERTLSVWATELRKIGWLPCDKGGCLKCAAARRAADPEKMRPLRSAPHNTSPKANAIRRRKIGLPKIREILAAAERDNWDVAKVIAAIRDLID